MSRINIAGVGNDTIHRYPLPHKEGLRKILCISKELFEKLKAALDEFGLRPRPISSKPKTPFRQKLPKKELQENSKHDDLKPDRDKCSISFEPSSILNTRNSAFWRLRNLNTWFKEQESYEDPRYLKAYSIKI